MEKFSTIWNGLVGALGGEGAHEGLGTEEQALGAAHLVALHLTLGVLVAHKVAGNGGLIRDLIALLAVVLSLLCGSRRSTTTHTTAALDDGGSAGGGGQTDFWQADHIRVQGIILYVGRYARLRLLRASVLLDQTGYALGL